MVFILLTTRLLGSEQFGVFIFLITISMVIASFFEMGLDLQIVRQISPDKQTARHYSSISIALRISGILGIVTVAFLLYTWIYSDRYDIWMFWLGITQGVFLFLLSHLRAIFRALEQLKYEALSIAIEKISIPILGFIILFTTADLLSFFLFYNGGSLIAVLFTLFFIKRTTGLRRISIPTKVDAVSILRPAFPFAVLNIIQTAYTRLGTLLIEALSMNSVWVGFHNAGARFADAFVVFPNTIMAAVYPVFCRVYTDKDSMWNLIHLVSRILLAIAVPVGTTVFIASYEFTWVVFGSDYIEGFKAVGVFGLTLIVTSQVFIMGSVVSASGNQMRANKLLAVVFFISLVAYLIFIPRYGFIAAAWITLADQIALLLINYWVTKTYYRSKTYLLNITKALVFPLISGIWYYTTSPELQPVLLLFLIGAWNLSGIFVTGLVNINDAKQLLKIKQRNE